MYLTSEYQVSSTLRVFRRSFQRNDRDVKAHAQRGAYARWALEPRSSLAGLPWGTGAPEPAEEASRWKHHVCRERSSRVASGAIAGGTR